MKVQGKSDVLRAWIYAQARGCNFHYISMPEEFQVELKEAFDPVYMKALFEAGFQQGKNGIPWRQTPAEVQDVDWPTSTQATYPTPGSSAQKSKPSKTDAQSP
jgi:hypothetical protein